MTDFSIPNSDSEITVSYQFSSSYKLWDDKQKRFNTEELKGVHLFQISAFYRNDQPDGIGVTITEEAFAVPLTEIMDDIMESYWEMWMQAEGEGKTEELVSDLLAQLSHASENRQKLEMIDAAWIIGNIWLLERVGAIESDEYNGCLFGAEGGTYQAIPPQVRG